MFISASSKCQKFVRVLALSTKQTIRSYVTYVENSEELKLTLREVVIAKIKSKKVPKKVKKALTCLVMLIRGVRVVTPVLEGNNFTNLSKTFSSFRKLSTCNRMSKKTACVFIANGSEEMESIISADVLRRGGLDVLVAGLPDSSIVQCSRQVNIKPDIGICEARSKAPFDVLVLPGGLGGSKAFAESKEIGELLKDQEKNGRWIAAICAAPTALKAHGVCEGKKVTSYPGMKEKMLEGGKYTYLDDSVVVDGNLITSRGPGTSFQFALTIVDKLMGKEKAVEAAKAMLVDY